jgi:isovaleryl-CoA dehydrogenase
MSFLSPCRAALLQSSRRTSRASSASRSLLATQWYQQRHASTKHPKGFTPPTQDDLEELRERTIEFARREIPQDFAQTVDHTNEFPNDMWKKMGEAGFLGITADEDYGGLAMGYQAHCTVMEELSRASGKIERDVKTYVNTLLTIIQDQLPSRTQPTVNSASTSSCSMATKTKRLVTSQV